MSKKYQITYTEGLPAFFLENKMSVLISTYQAAKVISIGSIDGKELFQVPVRIRKPMGIAFQDSKIAIAGFEEITFFSNNENVANTIKLNERQFDSVFIQRASYNTSSIDIHDIHFGDGVLWGVNTLFSCLCTFDINYNFRPKWKPKFIDALAPEDRCHLNGMAFEDGLPKYVTALSDSNVKNGWRTNKMNRGVLIEVATGDIILAGLAMPHSPRVINSKVYLLESGSGKLLEVDVANKSYTVVYDFGCFVRGLSSHNDFVIIGKSKIREKSKDFNELDVKENSMNAGIIVFDMKNKSVVGEINYHETVEEIFDVQVLKDIQKPLILGDKTDKFKQIITFPGNIYWRNKEEKPND